MCECINVMEYGTRDMVDHHVVDGGGRGQCASSDKSVGAFDPTGPMLLHHYTYNTQSCYMHEKHNNDTWRPLDMIM